MLNLQSHILILARCLLLDIFGESGIIIVRKSVYVSGENDDGI